MNPSMCEILLQQSLQRSKGVLHLGAHLGQEAGLYAQHGKPVIWVEALPAIHARLATQVESLPGQRAFCALLGERDGEQRTFYISNNAEGVSSSLFPFGQYGNGEKSLWPELGLAMVDSISLRTSRLDSLLATECLDVSAYDHWVVDLQGAELLALKGAGALLQHCRSLCIEVSTVEVYAGGVLWPELLAWLSNAGFTALWHPQVPHENVLFIRENEQEIRNVFHSETYLRHNQSRLGHLATLGLDLSAKSVLEVGAGIGDHTGFYLERGCRVTVTDARPENLAIIRRRFAGNAMVEVQLLDLDDPRSLSGTFDVVHCYGLLYHLRQPAQALPFLAAHCGSILLLETCVSRGDEIAVNPVAEPFHVYSQAFYGTGCRPTRPWVWSSLKEHMPHVYVSRTQPDHEEFPLDWDAPPENPNSLMRAVFVASRKDLAGNPMLLASLPRRQTCV